MDFALDTAWCPVCERAIEQLPPAAAASDSGQSQQPSPVSDSHLSGIPPKRSSSKPKLVGRANGLVHGTGRVKPGGGLRPLDTARAPSKPAHKSGSSRPDGEEDLHPPAPPPSPVNKLTVRARTSPVPRPQEHSPLYCSEECEREDARRSLLLVSQDISPVDVSSAQSQPDATLSRKSLPPGLKLKNGGSAPAEGAHPRARSTTALSTTGSSPSIATPPSPDHSRRMFQNGAGFTGINPEPPYKPTLSAYTNGTMMVNQRIENALLHRPQKQTKAPGHRLGESPVPPGWRHTDTEWRRIVYGSGFGEPLPRPTMPSRPNTTPAQGARAGDPCTSVPNGAPLSPFDRRPTASSVPNPNTTEQLYAKYNLAFARNRSRGAMSMHAIPTERHGGSSASSTTSSTRSSSRSRPPLSKKAHASDSDSETDDLDLPPTFGFGFSRDRSQTSLASLSRCGSGASIASERRSDPLARAMEKKLREDRKREREAQKAAEIERELVARESGFPQDEEEEELTQLVRELGPITARRTMSSEKTKKKHSWSYENLPAHIPLYNIADFSPKVRKMVRNESTGELEEVESEKKRLFIFGR